MERYVTFIRNITTREEFVSTRMAESGEHNAVLHEELRKYPSPTYKIHTTYTETELADVLETVRRWSGSAHIDSIKAEQRAPAAGVGFKINAPRKFM